MASGAAVTALIAKEVPVVNGATATLTLMAAANATIATALAL